MKHLNLNGRYRCSKNKGHFFGSLSIISYTDKCAALLYNSYLKA